MYSWLYNPYFTHFHSLKTLNELAEAAGLVVLNTCTSGVAARNVGPGARTLHNMLGFRARRKLLDQSKAQPISDVARRIEDADILIIDEASMASPALLAACAKRCTLVRGKGVPASDFYEEFGGLAVIVCGDLFQLETVKAASFQKVALDHYDDASLERVGADLFVQFRLVNYNVDVRVGDASLQRVLLSLRKGDTQGLADFIRAHSYDPTDLAFIGATIATSGNPERLRINSAALRRYATERGVPVFRWRLPVSVEEDDDTLKAKRNARLASERGISGKSQPRRPPKPRFDIAELISEAGGEDILAAWYDANTDVAMFEFAEGAPASTLTNDDPSRGFANGSPCTLHSLWWPPAIRNDPELLDLLARAETEGSIELPKRLVPQVLVRLCLSDDPDLSPLLELAQRDTPLVTALAAHADPLLRDFPAAALTLPDHIVRRLTLLKVSPHDFLVALKQSILERASWPKDRTCVPGDVVVPVQTTTVDGKKLPPMGKRGKALSVYIERPAVDLRFAITVHKSQGATIGKFIVVLTMRPNNPSPYNFHSVLVALSRVRHGDDIRFVFNDDEFDWDALRPSPILTAFLAGYDESGVWDRSRALASAAANREYKR